MENNMVIALIHWRIKPDEESIEKFLEHWKTHDTVGNRSGLITEFLSDPLSTSAFPYITWHLDAESLGDFKSYVTIGLWQNAAEFTDQIAQYFNDGKALLEFERYRRRRVVFKPIAWRVGDANAPCCDSPGVK